MPDDDAQRRRNAEILKPDMPRSQDEEARMIKALREEYQREYGPLDGWPKEKNMAFDEQAKRNAALAGAKVKNINEGKDLTATPVGTDDTRTAPLTPGYQPKYGETVKKIEPETDK